MKRNIHKQAKNTAHTNRNFFIQFSVAVMVVIAYFLTMFLLANTYISDIQILSKELATASKLEAYFSFAQNAQRELLYNPVKPLLKTNSFNVSKEALDFLYTNTQKLFESHQANRGLLGEDYRDQFYHLLNDDLCTDPLIKKNLIPKPCGSLFSNATLNVSLGSLFLRDCKVC